MSSTLYQEHLAALTKHYAPVVNWANKEDNTNIGVDMTVELNGQEMPIVYQHAMANTCDCAHYTRMQFFNLVYNITRCYRKSEIIIKQDDLIGDDINIIIKNGNAKITYTAHNINENERMNELLAKSEHPFKIKSLTGEWDDWSENK